MVNCLRPDTYLECLGKGANDLRGDVLTAAGQQTRLPSQSTSVSGSHLSRSSQQSLLLAWLVYLPGHTVLCQMQQS